MTQQEIATDRGRGGGADVIDFMPAALRGLAGLQGNGGTMTRTYPAIQQVRAYWEALRGDRQVPDRAEISPRGIERALDNAFLLDRIGPGLARIRLAGLHLSDLMGMEVRGMPVSALITAAARPGFAEALEAVFAGPRIADLSLSAGRGLGRPPLVGRMILLPLRSDRGEVTRAIGCLETDGLIGRVPRRLDLGGVSLHDIRGTAGGDTRPMAPRAPENVPAPGGFAEAAAAFSVPTKHPHLRVVRDRDGNTDDTQMQGPGGAART